jgi:hypothetical protein
VTAEVETELVQAEEALAPHGELAPTVLLKQLCDTLRNQVRNLQLPVGI